MNKHLGIFRFILFLMFSQAITVRSQTALPLPDHIVIAILENHSYDGIIGSQAAPYINSLAKDTSSALFTQSYGVTHPSQPNYLILFSGSTQGVKDDLIPKGNPFTTPNIERQLLNSGKTFVSYSEDLPQVGFNGNLSGNYARRHNPATNWMGKGKNQIPTTTNQPFTSFPSSDFTLLPTVCFVIPNTINDMHDGTDPTSIIAGDDWIKNNLDKYIQWAKANNSLFILTFDEDNDSSSNHITTIFTGHMVQAGQYSTRINHYSTLHTVERMYGLSFIGDSIGYPDINFCWKKAFVTDSITNGLIYPNPAHGFIYAEVSDYLNTNVEIYNLKGELIQVNPLLSRRTEIAINGLSSGFYIIRIRNKEGLIVGKIIKK